jgi:hypothetical protein
MSRRQSSPSVSFHQQVFAARATRNSAQNFTTGTTNIVVFDDLDYSSPTTAYDDSTGRFTCPAPGYYLVGAHIEVTDNTTSGIGALEVWLNAAAHSRLQFFGKLATNSEHISWGGHSIVKCAAGDVLDIRFVNGSGATLSLQGSTPLNWVMFYRLSGL